MTKASLRSPAGDTAVQRNAATVAKPATAAAAPTTRPVIAPARSVAPGVIQPRGATPATPRPATPTTAPAAPVVRVPRTTRPATPTVAPSKAPPLASRPVATPARPTAAPAAAQPPIDVQTEVVSVETPVEGLTIDTVNTSAGPAASVEDQLLSGNQEATAPAEAEVVEAPQDPEETAPAETTPNKALVVRPPSSLARASYSDGEGLTGDWGSEDLKFPRLTIVRGSGELAKQFNDGTLLYADQELLPPPSVVAGAQNPLLYFVPLQIKKGWREKLSQEDQDAGLLPRNASTVEEVEAMGGTTQWLGGKQPNWMPSAQCILLLEQPEGSDHPSFVLPLDGRNYAVALYYVSGGDFNAFAKLIYNTAKTVLQVPVLDAQGQPVTDGNGHIQKKTMLYKNFWTMNYAKVQRGNFQVWSPITRILAKEETGTEVRAYVEQLLGGNHVAADAE